MLHVKTSNHTNIFNMSAINCSHLKPIYNTKNILNCEKWFGLKYGMHARLIGWKRYISNMWAHTRQVKSINFNPVSMHRALLDGILYCQSCAINTWQSKRKIADISSTYQVQPFIEVYFLLVCLQILWEFDGNIHDVESSQI